MQCNEWLRPGDLPVESLPSSHHCLYLLASGFFIKSSSLLEISVSLEIKLHLITERII